MLDTLSSTALALPDWAAYAPTEPAEACLARFAAREADVADAGLVGLGRQSPARFPRLGGVLFGRVAPHTDAAALVLAGTEQTIRVGYQAALATHQVANEPVEHADADELWAAFVPASYRIPRAVAATVWELCRVDELWVTVLTGLGLEGDASRFGHGHVSPLSRSIRGLSTVGVALALAERGGRNDRPRAARRPPRARRLERRDLPPAPRAPVSERRS